MLQIVETLREDREKSLRKARREGVKEGENNMLQEVAKNMLRRNIPVEVISQVTGLSGERIRKLK